MRDMIISRRPYALAAGFVFCLALTSCGGGGGGSVAPTGGTPPVASTPAPVTQVSAQRVDANQSLQMLQISRGFSGGGLTLASSARRAASALRRVKSGGVRLPASIGPCSGGTEESIVQNSATSDTITEQTFYDTNCQTLEQSLVWNVTANSATSLSGPGTLTQYSTTGNVIGSETFYISATFTDSTLSQLSQLTVSESSSSGSVGLSCGLTGSTNAIACGMAVAANSSALSEELGFSMTLTGSETATSSGTTDRVSVSGQAYQGSLNSLSIAAGTFPSWSVSGGTLIDSASATVVATYGLNGVASSLNFAMTDVQNGATVTLAATQTGVTGTVAQTSTGAVEATFRVDQLGNGTITYSNGTQAQIQNYQVLS